MDSENSKRNSLPNSQSLPNIQSGLKVPFQAIIAMKDLEELKKKYGNQRGNSYQQGGLKRKLKSFSIMKGKKSLEKNQIPSNVKERSFINVVKNTENLKILDQDYLNYEHEKMEIANVKKKQEKVSVVGSPQFKINAQQFQSRKFDNIQKQTLGIHSLMLDSQQRQIKFPKINKMQSDDQFLSLMEKSIKTQRETEDLLQNISRIIAGPGLGEQTSLFEDKQNLNFSISKTSDKNSILRKNQSEIFFQVNNNQQATEEDEHFQNQLINIINDQSNQEYWSEQSNFKDQKQRNINLHALEIQDMSVIHSNTKNKKDSIFQNMLSLFNRKSIQPLDYTPSNIRKKNISLGNQQSISLKDSKHINLSPQNNTSKLIEDSVIQGSILNEDSLGNDFNDIFHQQPRGINQTFEDDFCDPTLLLEPLEEQDSNILNINIPHKNNFRIEPLDQYDEYALQDANFKEMLSAGPQQAMSRWQDKNGKVFWKNCIVLDYNEQTKFFTIQWSNIQKAKYKKVKRLNLMFYFDDPAEYKKRYRAAVKKREEFLLNQQLTQHIDQKQGQETMSLPIDRLSQTIDCILENHENKEEKKEKIMKEVVGLYKFQLVKFDTEFEAVRYDVNSYYQKYLPYLSANNFVNKLPLKDKEKFEFQEVGQESGCLKQQITRYITNKPHLVQDKNNLKLFSWVEFGNKNKLNIQEVASLQLSQVMLGFISSIESLDYFKQFKTFKKTIQASSFEINKNYTQEFMRAIEQIDRLAYKVEKGIDEMKIDFQPQLCIESSKLLFSLSNKLIKNAIEKSFKRSTAQLIEQLDKFYAFLPLPEIGIKVIKKLPEQFFIKRTQQRKQMLLDTDQQVEDRLFKLQLNFISNIQQKRESSLFVNSNEQNSASSPQNNSKDAKKQDSNLFITSQNSKKQIDSQRLSEIPAKLNLQLQQLSNEQTLQQQQQQIQQLASKGVEESLHAIIFPIYKNLQSQDRQIINSIAQALQNQFLENQKPLIQLNFINPNLNGLPQFAKYEIEWVLNKEIKTEKRNYEQRKKQRKKYREIFYSQNETSEIVLIKQNIQQKEDKKLVNRGNKVTNNQNEDFQTENKMDEYESITKGRFDFINFQYLVTTTSPSLNSLEKLIKESFKIPLEKINMLYQIGSQETVLFESEEFKIDSEGVKSSIQEIIPWSFYGIYAFLILINSFSFHFTQKRYYIQDIQSEFDKKSLGLYFFCEEINILEKDLMFFRIGLPNYLNFGFILLKTETLKQEYIQQIKFYINQLKKIIQDKLVSQLQATRQQVQNFTERLQKNPATIKDYSEISDYLSSQAILEQYTDLQTQINYINDLMKVCDEYSLEISFETIQMQVESRSWILQLRNIEQEQLKKLYQIKPKFEKTLKESIANLLTNFEKQKKLSDELKQQGSLDNIYVLSSQTKSLKNQLDEIYQKAQELNQFENYLKMSPITNFCEIEICLNDLMKYYDLWDFAERWKLRYEEWTTRPLVFMESKEVVDTLNEGFQLLPDLILDFKDNPLFITIIKQLEEEIQKFNNYTHIIIQLRDTCFKQRHWDELIDEIQKNKNQQEFRRIDSGSVTLKRLIDEEIQNYSSFINKLYLIAQQDYQIELELQKIEGILKDTFLRTLPYYLDVTSEFTFKIIKNTSDVIKNLSEAKFRSNILIKNLSFIDVFKKRMHSVHKLARNGKKVIKIMSKVQNTLLDYISLFIQFQQYENTKISAADRLFSSDLIKLLQSLIDDYSQHLEILTISGLNIFNLFSETESQERSFPQSDEFRRRLLETQNLSNKLVQEVKKVLNRLRFKCSRLYFLSDEGIIEILRLCNQTSNPQLMINKLFLPLFKGFKSLKVQSTCKEVNTNLENEQFAITNYSNVFSIESIQNQLDEILLLDDKINIDISKGIENAIDGQMKLEESMRYLLRKQFLKNTQTLTRLGLDYNEIYRLLHLKNEIIFQIAYLNIDICFYHDLTTTILNSEENDEVPDLNLLDFLQKIRMYMHNFINNQMQMGLTKNELLKFSGLVMQSLNHQNILQRFIDQKVDTLASFDYLGLPKFSVEVETNQILRILQQNKHNSAQNPLLQLNQQEIIQHMLKSAKLALDNRESTDYPNLSENSEFFYYFSLIDNPQLINVNLMCMNYKRGYTWEFIAGDHYTFVNTYQTERMLFNIIGAISTNTSILIRGPQSSGKQSTVSYLATILAKPYFTWKFSDQNDFSSLNQVLIGTAQGGYITLIQNCEYLNVGMISTLANIIFQIRNSCISKIDILDSNNCPIKVSEHWGLYASFTVRQDSQVLQFSQIPNILESFRTVSIVQPDIQTILAAKLTLMNFIRPIETAQRLHVFFQLLSSSLSNSHFLVDSFKQLDVITLDQVSQTEFNQHLFNPNTSTIMKIISHAEYFLFEKKVSNEDEIENYTLLYSAINTYYAHALSQFHLKLLNNLFIKLFPESQVSEGYLFKDFQDDGANEEEEANEGKQKTVQILQTPQVSSSALHQNKDDNQDDDFEHHVIDYFQKVHKVKPSERFIDTILDMIFNININKTILVVGLNSKVKDYALNAAAYVSSLFEKAQFYKHYITLDANDYTFLMGEHIDGVWRKGILQQLLDSITYMSENGLYSEVLNQYYRSNYLNFITSQANPLDNQNKIQNLQSKSIESNVFLKKNQQGKTKNPQTILTLKDWIIFETSNTNFKGNQSKFIDQMIKSIHQRILFFDNGQQIQLQSTLKLILNLDSLDNITPGCLGNFQIFNFGYNNYVQKNQSFAGNNIVSQGFNWSIKNDFESWLDTLISKNKFFNYCEKILRTCYVYLFEPILVFLKDSLEQTSSGEAKKLFNNPGAIVDIILHQQQNFLSLLEIFMNEFRKTMVALGKYAITSNSSTMKDVRSKAFYTFISLQNKKQASPVKNADLNDSQHQLNTDASYLEKEFRAPVESIFLFSIVQGMCSSYINPNFLSQLTEHCLGCVKKLKLAHENIFSSQFKACQNLSKLLKQNKSLSVLDLIYDISELAWVRISEFQIPENIPLLDSSLSNDHLELSEIVRLNKNALQVEEMKKLMENNQEIVYQLPTHEKQVVYLSAPFKTTKYLIDYLMGYKKNIFVYSTPQAGKTKLFQYLERQHLVKNTYKINVIQLLRNTKIGQFQQFVENSLSFKNFQTKQSEIGKCSYAFIDDLNFVSLEGPNIIGCLRSLIAHGGWISQQKNRFLRFENCNVICNYSSRKLFSEDFSKFAELGSCLREMFMLKFPDMNGDHLTGIFMEILKTSPMFNTKEKMQANILAADILQKQLAKFAHNYMSSIPKLTQITQIFKINFNISKVLTLITSTLSHQQIVQNGQLNESFFEQMWTYILDACFLDSLPWNKNPIFLEKLKSSQKTNAKNQFIFNLLKDSLSDSGSDEEFDNIQQNSPLKKGSLSMNQNYNIPNLSLHTEGQQSQNKAIEIQHFLVETLYSPKKTKKTVETKGLVKLGQINRVRMSKQVNIEIERQYFKLENIDQFENRTRFLNQYFTQKIDKGQESLLKQLQKLSEQKIQKFPAKIHKFFIKTMSYYYEDEKINKSNLDKTKKIYVPHNLTNSQLSNGQASLLKIENLNFSQLNIEQDQNRFMHNMSDRDQFYFIHEDQNNFISYLQNKLLEYLFQPPQQKYEIQASKNQKEGNGAQNEKEIINDYFNIHAYWDIQIQQGGVENILGDLSAILNNIYIMKQNISLYTPTSKSELIKFISYLMGSNCIIIKISSENCVSVLLQTILDILKGMIEGNPVHTLVQFTISDLKSKEFKRIFEIFQIIKIIIQNSNLEGIFSQKQLKQLLEPWKQSQVKKVTTLQQMEINVSEKDIKSKLGGFKPNLVENHMIYILRQKLKDYISFIIEINPDNYKEYLILKDQIPKSFTHFNDHFSFLQKSNQKKNSSEQDDINKLINQPTMQEIQNKFWQAEKGVSELFEINYFQTSIKSQKEIEFFVPHLARLIQNNLQSTITQISSKKNVSQIINIDMIKQPINDKLKQLLEELLNYKMKYIDIKKQYENLQKLHETYKNFSSYKMNYSKLQINHEKDKVQREGKRKSSINNHLYNPNDQKLIQSEHQSIQTNKMINQSNLSSRRFNRSGSNDIHQSQDEQKMMESHRIYLEEIKDDKNEILHKLETAKKSYQNAFKNFRYINLLLCQLLKTIHYFRQECNPILTFQEGELAKYAYDIALYSLSALKYPSCYRENLFDVLLQQNKKLNIPFYKILLDSPTAYLEQLINGTDLGINIINEYSLINFLIGVDLLPLCITDETGGYLQYLQNVCIQKQKRSMHIEYNTVDEDSLENVENAILKGSYLVLHNPDETLVDLIQPILQFKYKNLIKSLIQFKNLQNQQKLDELFTFNQKRIKLHSQFRLIMITSSYSSFLIKSFNASSIFVHLSFQDKKFFSSFVYDNILNTFYQAEKQKLIKGEIFKRDILSKQDYSLERILPIILKLSLSEKDSWNPLIQLLPHHIINQAAAKEGFTDNFGEDDQLLQIGQISNELIMKNLEDTEKDQLMLNFQNAELRNSIDLEKSNSSMGSKQGELSKQSKNFKEIYGDVSLHSQIGQHLQNMKEEDEELKTSQYQRQSSFKRQQTLKEKSSQIKRQNTVFSQVSQTESEAMASSNDLENNLPQYCFFNFEILDFQSNNSLSPEYPSQKLVNIASKFKILVEILYGLKLSYKEVVTQIEKEDSSIKYSEENFLLVFKQVSDCLKLNQFNNIQTNQFNKRFASMSYHYLYCTLREDHQTVWQLTLSFFFQMSALTDKKQINYTYLQQKVLLEQRIKPIQNLVFSKLSTNRYWDSFITSLVDLYGSYDNLIAPLINFSYQFEEKIMNNQEKSKIIKNIHNQFKQLNQIRRDSINKVTEQKSLASQQLMQKSSFYSKKNIIQEFSLEKIEESNSSQANFFKRKDHFKAQNSEEIKVEQSQECNQDSNSDQNVDGDQSQDIEKEIKQENEQLKQQNKNQQQSEIIDSLNSENQISNQKQTIKQIETETPSLNEVQNTYQKLMDGPISDEDEFEENKQLNIVLENQEDKQKITRAMSEYYYNQGNQVIKKEPEQNKFLESIVEFIDDGLLEQGINIISKNKQDEDQNLIKQDTLISKKMSSIDELEQDKPAIQSQLINDETNDQNNQNQDPSKKQDNQQNLEDGVQKVLAQISSDNVTVNKINLLLLQQSQSDNQDESQTQDIGQQVISTEQNNVKQQNIKLDEIKISSKQNQNLLQSNNEDQSYLENSPARSKQHSVCSSLMDSPNDYMVKEEDFNSPLPQKQNQMKILQQSNFLIQFKEQNRISQQIIDIPNVRNQDVQDKDYMLRMEQEFNLNTELGGQSTKENVSQKQFKLQNKEKPSYQAQEQHESTAKNKENKSYMSQEINQFNMIDRMDSIIQLAKENNYIKRPALGLPLIKSKFDNLRYDNDLMWFGINSYKAIFHSSQVLGSKELQNTLTSLQIEKDLWKSMFFLSHSQILRDDNNYIEKMKEKLGDINMSIFLKFFRPDILENIINVHLTKQLSKFFISHTKTNLNAHSRANWYNKPTVIFYGHLNKTINELLELKACKQSQTIKVKRIPLGSISNKIIKQELSNASIKGDWIVLENIKSVPYDQLGQLIKIINNALNSNQNKNEYFKVWITQQQMNKSYQLNENSGIVQTHRKNSQTLLQQFFFNCFKMFINRPDNIKNNLSVLYTLEIHEYLAFVEKKVTQTLPTNYNFSTLGKQLQSPIHEAIKYRFQKQKRHENINYSYNIHSVFIDRIALREKNKHAVNILEKFSNKIKFNIFFIFSILRSRQKYHRKIAEYYQQSELLFFSDLDLLYVVEDGFHFLNYYSINPSLFFRNYLKLIFSEEMPYNAHSTWTIASMRDLLEELVFKAVDKQTIYTSGDQKYTLFFEQPHQSTEETIFKTINDLPNLDSPQTIEISPNTEIQYGFNRSQRLMSRIHKKVQLQEQLGKEAEMLRELKDQIAYTSEDKESLSDVSLVSTNDKNLQLDDSDDFTLQQVGQIYAYWINHIDLLGKNMTIIQKIQQIQNEFKILFEKSQNLDLFSSKFAKHDIQEENDSDSDSSSDMSEDQNIQQAKLSKISKNGFQIKLRKNKDSDSSFDSSFSDSKNEQENQYQKGKSVSPKNQSFVDDHYLKKDLQKWFSDKPLHAAPVISRKSNLLNSIEKSETQLSTNRLSSPKIKSSLRQPSIANIMLGNLQSSPQLNLKMNHRISVAAIASPHRQSVFFGKQFIVENTSNTLSPNLNSPSKNSHQQSLQSPPTVSSPLFHPRKESIFVKLPNTIGQNLIRVNAQEQLSSNRVSDSVQLFSLQTNQPKDGNQPVYNSTLQNELQIAKSLLKRIITDLDDVIQYVLYRQSSFSQQEKSLLQTGFLKTSEQEAILINILENKVPQNWWIQSFLIRENDLQQYMKYLILKLETLKLILEERRCKMYPVIQLDQMFDPFFLISSYLTHKSTELNMSIFDLKIECEIQNKPSVQQPTDGSMLINGFFIKNGRLNEHALDIEHPREFEYKIPNMKIMVKKKIYKNNFFKNYPAHMSMNFVDDSLYDFEGTYYAQNQFINGTKKVQKSEFVGKKTSNDSKQYVVRLPVVNSLTNHLFNSFPMRIYFYFRSSKPQEFWVKRSTEIYLQQEFL